MLAAPAFAGKDRPPCQTGQVRVVPQGKKGTLIQEFVTAEGDPARSKTSALVKWDDEALSVIFDCEDKQIVSRHTDRDDDESADDSVDVFLDIDHTHDIDSFWVHLILSASGGIYDEQGPVAERWSKGGVKCGMIGFDPENMKTKAETTAEGWRAEIVIPWADMEVEPPKVGDVWGFNLNRRNRPDDEYLCWSPTYGLFYSMEQWGHLVFADENGEIGMTAEELKRKLAEKHAPFEKPAAE
jgi:hypothetical protein